MCLLPALGYRGQGPVEALQQDQHSRASRVPQQPHHPVRHGRLQEAADDVPVLGACSTLQVGGNPIQERGIGDYPPPIQERGIRD